MTDGVRIPRDLADEMVEHCRTGRPNEACGMLAASDGVIVKVFRMTNEAASPVRYKLVPEEQHAVNNTLYREGWDLGGVFHSHTRTEAYPSPTDVGSPTEDVPYIIVSLAKEPPSVRAFRIVKDNWMDSEGRIEEVEVHITG